MAQIGSLALVCAAVSFTVGMQTAGEVHPFETSQAADTESLGAGSRATVKGDLSGNGILDIHDALLLLEYVDGFVDATAVDLRRGDLNGDLRLTNEDVRRLLHSLSLR
jgi:hypothetical protein